MLDGQVDPYADPASGVLRNRLGLTDRGALAAAEADLVVQRQQELARRPVQVTGDLAQLQAIHRRLFQDVFEWAGQLRTVDLAKSVPGAEHFMAVSRLRTGAGFAFEQLADDGLLRGLEHDRCVARLAFHYDQVNYLHPFREGNGRTQRLFWSQIAEQAGWLLDFRRTTGTENDAASREAMRTGKPDALLEMLARVVQPADRARLPDAAVRAERVARLGFGANALAPVPASAPSSGRPSPGSGQREARRP